MKTLQSSYRRQHVLVEKPIALDGAWYRMIAEAEHAGKILMSAQVLRFFPSMWHCICDARSRGAKRFFAMLCSAGLNGWLKDASKAAVAFSIC